MNIKYVGRTKYGILADVFEISEIGNGYFDEKYYDNPVVRYVTVSTDCPPIEEYLHDPFYMVSKIVSQILSNDDGEGKEPEEGSLIGIWR